MFLRDVVTNFSAQIFFKNQNKRLVPGVLVRALVRLRRRAWVKACLTVALILRFDIKMTNSTVRKIASNIRWIWRRFALLLAAHVCLGAADARSEGCPTARDEISTDRPDVTNSSIVVPAGSLQIENGINVSANQQARALDGTNTDCAWVSRLVLNCFWIFQPTMQACVVSEHPDFPMRRRP